MTEKKIRQKFTDEFKKEAVSLMTVHGCSFAQDSEAVGVRV